MTVLYYTFFEEEMANDLMQEMLNILPLEFSLKVRKFYRWQDAHASLFGKLLLVEGFKNFGFHDVLSDVRFTKFGKPHLQQSTPSFNISHSGNCVVCVISDEVETIGIDVEEIKPVNIKGLRNFWSDEEWHDIVNASPRIFYQYWTRKESVVKADGRGLGAALKEIDVRKMEVECSREKYTLGTFDIHSNYVLHYAAKKRLTDFDAKYISVADLCIVARTSEEISLGQ